jgi:SAM-dependent methyltransferase
VSLAEYYKKQLAWRDWESVYRRLPLAPGHVVLDIGCGVGDQAAALVERGARVIGFDAIEEVLEAARARGLKEAEFRCADLRQPLDVGVDVDGVWASFTAAYFVDLPAALTSWTSRLRPGGWVALTEIDDFFGHEPVEARTRELFEAYAREALAAKRYDFRMGRRLRESLEAVGMSVAAEFTVRDLELSFDGPAAPEVIEAWGTRLDWMKLLREMCGAEFTRVRADLLACLGRSDHRARARVVCCVARR